MSERDERGREIVYVDRIPCTPQWNKHIYNCVEAGQMEKAMSAARDMMNLGIEPSVITFNSLIKVPAEFKVDERTLTSRDIFKEITQMNLNAKSDQMATGGTKLHDQKDTNFCAYFATMSALSHQLRKIVGTGKTRDGEEIKEYLERRDKKEKRFERDLSVMIGCVSPRSLSARFKITFKIS